MVSPGCREGEPPPPVEIAEILSSIRAEAVAGHVRALADDRLEGRETGTNGHLLAAEYVARNFYELGLRPAGDAGDIYQRVPLLRSELEPGSSAVILRRADGAYDLQIDVDYLMHPDPLREAVEITAPLALAGFGIVAPELERDDYGGVDVRGRVVALFRGVPASFPPDARAFHSSDRIKRRAAVARGALGIVWLRTPREWEQHSWQRVVGRSRSGSMRWLDLEGKPNDSHPELFVELELSPAGTEQLFEGAPVPLEQVIREAEAGRASSFELPLELEARAQCRHTRLESPNVVALLPGSDPELQHETVTLNAHLDHLGVDEPAEGGVIYNGAYDNASGVAVLLEVARALSGSERGPRRSVLFLASTGSEQGLLGADYFVHHPTVELDGIVAAIDLDTVLMQHALHDVTSFGAGHSALGREAERAVLQLGLVPGPDTLDEELPLPCSDHDAFVRGGIPSLSVAGGFERGADTDGLDQPIDFEAGARFAQVSCLLTWLVADSDEAPLWIPGNIFAEHYGRSGPRNLFEDPPPH